MLFACLLASGCGANDWGEATGTATLDGVPLDKAIITFHPTGPGATAFGQVTAGSFAVSTGSKDGLPVGKYRVTVSATTVPESGTAQQAKLLTPARYARPDSTPLDAVVKPGSNRFTFDLKAKP